MGIVDIVIIGLLLLLLLIGIGKGFIKQAFNIIAWLGAIVVPLLFYGPVTKIVAGDVDPVPFSTTAIVFVCLFIVTFILIKIIGKMLGDGTQKTALGIIDRLLGAAWGLAKGLIIISVVFLAINWLAGLPLIGEKIQVFIDNNIIGHSTIGIGKYLFENNLLLKLMEVINLSKLPLEFGV